MSELVIAMLCIIVGVVVFAALTGDGADLDGYD